MEELLILVTCIPHNFVTLINYYTLYFAPCTYTLQSAYLAMNIYSTTSTDFLETLTISYIKKKKLFPSEIFGGYSQKSKLHI